MKKKWCVWMLAAAMTLAVTACGGDDVKEISKDVPTGQEQSAASGEAAASGGENTTALSGFVFETEGVSFTADQDMAQVLEKLGEPVSYYEAASCAFQGLDKIYTYQHFEINTYPDGDRDLISSIVLKDDLISTPEGLSIGQTKAEMEAIYGTDYETRGNMCVYTKDGMHLSVLVEGDAVTSIEYDSAVLDTN